MVAAGVLLKTVWVGKWLAISEYSCEKIKHARPKCSAARDSKVEEDSVSSEERGRNSQSPSF